MTKCRKCSKKGCLTLECKYCGLKFCPGCLQIEVHQCEHGDKCISQKYEELKSKLESEGVEENKMRCPKII